MADSPPEVEGAEPSAYQHALNGLNHVRGLMPLEYYSNLRELEPMQLENVRVTLAAAQVRALLAIADELRQFRYQSGGNR